MSTAEQPLQKKTLRYDDIKPGMMIWSTNPQIAVIQEYLGVVATGSKSTAQWAKHASHWEIVLDKVSGKGSNYVVTVQKTTFGGTGSLRDRGIDRDKWKELVPVAPRKKETDEQFGPLSYKRGLEIENGGWIVICSTTKIPPKDDGTYVGVESEMDGKDLEELYKRAKANEKNFRAKEPDIKRSLKAKHEQWKAAQKNKGTGDKKSRGHGHEHSRRGH